MVALQRPPTPATDPIIEFRAWLLADYRLSPTTGDIYSRHIRDLSAWLARHHPARRWRDVTEPILTAHLELVAAERGESSRSVRIAALRHWWTYLILAGFAGDDPTVDLALSPRHATRPVILTSAQVAALWETTSGPGWLDRRNRALLGVLFGTGMQSADVIGLSPASITNRDGGVGVTIPGCGKGARTYRQDRWLSLPDAVLQALADFTSTPHGTGYSPHCIQRGVLFPNWHGERLARGGLWRILTDLGVAAGLPVTPNVTVIRATVAHGWLATGIGTAEVATRLGVTGERHVLPYAAAELATERMD